MYQSDSLTVWNLTPDGEVVTGAQRLFNVLGRVAAPDTIARFSYRLNGGPERPVVFSQSEKRLGRLHRQGDFSIDTIALDDLRDHNQIVLRLVTKSGAVHEHPIAFRAHPFAGSEPRFHLALDGIEHAEQVGQMVDGRFVVTQDERGERCLEVNHEDAGYDRIMVFGRHEWTSGYEITARMTVTEWVGAVHLAGLLFKWQPHAQGDGNHLPANWTTGIGYYSSEGKGLRIHYGVNVRSDHQQDHVLAETPLSRWRYWAWQVQYGRRRIRRFGRERLPFLRLPVAQMIANQPYDFRLLIRPDRHALTVWPTGSAEPAPQLVVERPTEYIPGGSVGVVWYHCAARLYQFDVAPA